PADRLAEPGSGRILLCHNRCRLGQPCRLRLSAWLRLLYPLSDLGESRTGRSFSSENQVGGAFEIVVLVSVDVGIDDQVGGRLPYPAVHLLGNRKTLTD